MDPAVTLAAYPELDDRIVIVRAGDQVDAVLVRTERCDVLVDTLGTPQMCREALSLLRPQTGGRPLLVVNSHMDWDHFWGNAAVADAPIIAHAAALERLREPSARQVLADKAQAEARFRGVELVGASLTFSDRMTIHGGDLTLELIHTPGHTPDHVAVWIPELRTCLAVDAVEFPVPEVWSRTARDLKLICASLQRIRDLNAKLVVAAHGRTCSPAIVDANIRYFDELAARVATLGEERLADPQLGRSEGCRLGDLVALPADMPAPTLRFYEGCHETNLGATVAARREQLG